MARTSTLSFGSYGDVTIHWEAKNDDKVLPVIQQMIDRGVRFFVIGKKKLLAAADQTQVTSVDQAKKARKIVIPDEALENLHQAGLITTDKGKVVQGEIDTVAVAKTAAQVAAADTVAVAPARGG